MNNCKMHKSCFLERINIQHYIERLGPVMYGVKPIHLFSFSDKQSFKQKHIKELKCALDNCTKLDYLVIKCDNGNIKMLVYNQTSCAEVLSDKRNQCFLTRCGCYHGTELECYFEYFINELKKNIIPHEMGLFFGYPLKDVMGFMGMTRLKHTKTRGWKVFGDPRVSDEKFLSFEEAENRMHLFASGNPTEYLMSGAF